MNIRFFSINFLSALTSFFIPVGIVILASNYYFTDNSCSKGLDALWCLLGIFITALIAACITLILNYLIALKAQIPNAMAIVMLSFFISWSTEAVFKTSPLWADILDEVLGFFIVQIVSFYLLNIFFNKNISGIKSMAVKILIVVAIICVLLYIAFFGNKP